MNKPGIAKVVVINFVRRGGMVHYHAQLVNALSEKIETMAVISSAAPRELYDSNVSIMPVDTGASGRQAMFRLINPLTYWRMRRLIRSLDADVVHVTSPYLWNIFLLFWLKAPLVYTVHDPLPHQGERWYIRWIERRLRQRARILIVHGQKAVTQMRNQGYAAEKLISTVHGDFSFFGRWAKEGTAEEPAILFFGRIEPYKGLDVLLGAMKSVWETLPKWRLIIAGHGTLPEEFDHLHDPRVELHNYFIPDQDVAAFFQRSAIVVLPYISATQSGVVPIASVFAKPVVATRVGGLPEAVADGQSGLLVEAGDRQTLAQAIIRLAQDDQGRHHMGRVAYDKMTSDMSWDTVSDTLLAAYDQAVSSS